jgi:predicted tellurium resistance membrane protein TerC
MMGKNFEESAKNFLVTDFKERLKTIIEKQKKIHKQLNNLYKKLDGNALNEENKNELFTHLPVHLTQIEIIDEKIKEILEIIEVLKDELID